MNNIEYLINKHKNKAVNIGEKTADEISDILMKKEFVVPVDFYDEFSEARRKIIITNIINSEKFKRAKSEGLVNNSDEFEFTAFMINNNGDGKYYYETAKERLGDNEKIYLIIERKTKYLECNCSKLFLDIKLEIGVNEYDYNNNTIWLADYLSAFEALENHWY